MSDPLCQLKAKGGQFEDARGVACVLFFTKSVIHGHRTLKAPHPVRSAQLTRVPPS